VKRLIFFLAASVLATAPAVAEPQHEHSAPAEKQQDHMKLMREQMAQIRAATDPKERERLMNEHMKTMEQSMAKMRDMMGCEKM
jgi:Flp pilus assembly protein TadB